MTYKAWQKNISRNDVAMDAWFLQVEAAQQAPKHISVVIDSTDSMPWNFKESVEAVLSEIFLNIKRDDVCEFWQFDENEPFWSGTVPGNNIGRNKVLNLVKDRIQRKRGGTWLSTMISHLNIRARMHSAFDRYLILLSDGEIFDAPAVEFPLYSENKVAYLYPEESPELGIWQDREILKSTIKAFDPGMLFTVKNNDGRYQVKYGNARIVYEIKTDPNDAEKKSLVKVSDKSFLDVDDRSVVELLALGNIPAIEDSISSSMLEVQLQDIPAPVNFEQVEKYLLHPWLCNWNNEAIKAAYKILQNTGSIPHESIVCTSCGESVDLEQWRESCNAFCGNCAEIHNKKVSYFVNPDVADGYIPDYAVFQVNATGDVDVLLRHDKELQDNVTYTHNKFELIEDSHQNQFLAIRFNRIMF